MFNFANFETISSNTNKTFTCRKSTDQNKFDWCLSSLPTECSENSSSPSRTKCWVSYTSDISNQIRICLMNEVLPNEKKTKLQKAPLVRMSRMRNKCSSQFNSSEKFRSTSLSQVSSLMQSDISNKNIHEENKVKTIALSERFKAFDILQSIAANIRLWPDMINVDQDKYEYLRDIHEGQNDEILFESSQIYQSKSVAANSPYSIVSSWKSSNISVKSNWTIAKAHPLNAKSLRKVSIEVMLGLDSILKSIESVDKPLNSASNKISKRLKKCKSLKKKTWNKNRSSPCKPAHQINIPTERLMNIVNSLSLI